MSEYDLTNLVKQAIVVRKDLKMKPGKIGAQVSHASQEFIWDQAEYVSGSLMELCMTSEQQRWRETGYRKILLAVNSEEELFAVRDAALAAGLTVHVVQDEGLTQIEPGTFTCLAIGPHFATKLEPITQGLKLLCVSQRRCAPNVMSTNLAVRSLKSWLLVRDAGLSKPSTGTPAGRSFANTEGNTGLRIRHG